MSTAIMPGELHPIRPRTPPNALARRAWRVLAEQSDEPTLWLLGNLEPESAWEEAPIGARTVRDFRQRYIGRASPLTRQDVARIEAREIAASHVKTLARDLDMCMECPGPAPWPCERSRWAARVLRGCR